MPIQLEAANLYLFVHNAPVNAIDPFGLVVYDEDGFPIGDKVGDICKKPKPRKDPGNCPPGTVPINKYQKPKLTRQQIHDIKDGIGAGSDDWTGIDPNGNVRYNEAGKCADGGSWRNLTH